MRTQNDGGFRSLEAPPQRWQLATLARKHRDGCAPPISQSAPPRACPMLPLWCWKITVESGLPVTDKTRQDKTRQIDIYGEYGHRQAALVFITQPSQAGHIANTSDDGDLSI